MGHSDHNAMLDLNAQAARRQALRAARVNVAKEIRSLSLEDQRDLLLDLVVEVDAQLNALAPPQTALNKGAEDKQGRDEDAGDEEADDESDGDDDEGSDDEESGGHGITALVLDTLGQAGKPLTSAEVATAVEKVAPGRPRRDIRRVLSRLVMRDDPRIKRVGKAGKQGSYKYTVGN